MMKTCKLDRRALTEVKASPWRLMALLLICQSAAAQQWLSLGPAPRALSSAVLDSSTNRMIVFGGGESAPNGVAERDFNDVWRLGGVSWNAVKPTGTPPAGREGHSAVYDGGSNRMIVFGGGLGSTSPCENDVWVLTNANGNGGTPSWIQLTPAGTPPASRLLHSAVYDPNTNTMIVYGGNDCFSTTFSDVWILSNANAVSGTPTWTELFPSGTGPGARADGDSVAYDAVNNRLILFGGSLGGTLMNDVWVLTNANGSGGTPVWTQLSPSGILPSARFGNSATYDASSNRLIIFGGGDSATVPFGDNWVLTNANGLGGTPSWTELGPINFPPQPRFWHTAVYNSSTNKETVFGGLIGTGAVLFQVNDAWVLTHANGE